MIPETHIAALNELIAFLNDNKKQTPEVSAKKHEAFSRQSVSNMFDKSVSFGEATNVMPHLNRPDASIYIRSIDNNLFEQVKITKRCVEFWFSSGEHPAPYYPWRITVILRKQKCFDLEKEFLSAYCRHFYNKNGARDAKIAERAAKIGAYRE